MATGLAEGPHQAAVLKVAETVSEMLYKFNVIKVVKNLRIEIEGVVLGLQSKHFNSIHECKSGSYSSHPSRAMRDHYIVFLASNRRV